MPLKLINGKHKHHSPQRMTQSADLPALHKLCQYCCINYLLHPGNQYQHLCLAN